MASPQKEDGHVEIANEIIEILAMTYLSSYESQVLWAIFRKTYGWNKKEDWITNTQITKMTGIAESHVSRTIKKLIKRNIVNKNDKKLSFQKDYDKWQKLPKQVSKKKIPKQDSNIPKQVSEVTQTGIKKLPKQVDTKDTKDTTTKNTIQKTSQDSFSNESTVYQLVIYLDGKIRENNEAENKKPKKTEKQLQSWCIEMDKLIRIDHAKPDDIKKVINWVVEDDFWSSNILSVIKLRKHYSRCYKKAIYEESPYDNDIIEIVDYLNKKIGTDYQPTTELTRKLIKARLKEGNNIDAFKWVIDVKCEEWKGKHLQDGKDMEDFLRPQTLFSNKFEGYLNQSKREKPE